MLLPRLLFATGLMALSAHALATPPVAGNTTTVLGLTLTAPLTLPECPTGFSTRKQLHVYDGNRPWTQPCYLRGIKQMDAALIGSEQPLGTERVGIFWPKDQHPAIAVPGTVEVVLIEGRVHHITAHTKGVETQNANLQELIRQFGPPRLPEMYETKTPEGATRYEFRATWWWTTQGGNTRATIDYLAAPRLNEPNPGRLYAFTPDGFGQSVLFSSIDRNRQGKRD